MQGLEDGRFALISKTHHALVDGISGVDISNALLDYLVPDEARRARTAGPEPELPQAQLVTEGIKGMLRTPGELPGRAAARSSVRAKRRAMCARPRRESARWSERASTPAPDVLLNVPIGPHRRLWWLQRPLAEFKGIKNAPGAR